MDTYKRTELLLYSYKTLVAEVKNLLIEISELEYKGVGAMSYEEHISGSGGFSSVVENEVIHRQEEADKIADIIFMKENVIKKIDNVLESLDARSRDIIKLSYFNKISNTRIGASIDRSEEWVCRLKSRAVNKIGVLTHNIRL